MHTAALRFLSFVGVLCVAFASAADMPSEGQGKDPRQDYGKFRPFCGLYSLYAAIKHMGGQADFRAIATPEFCSDSNGSSLVDLQKAAGTLGYYGVPLKSMRTDFLETLHLPAILHVKMDSTAEKFNHYELFVRDDQGYALMHDPPDAPRRESYEHLRRRWDGMALVVSPQEINVTTLLFPAHKRVVYVLGGAIVALFCYWAFRNRGSSSLDISRKEFVARSIKEAVFCLVAASLTGFSYGIVSEQGLLAKTPSVDLEFVLTPAQRFGNLTVQQLNEALLDNSFVIVDARKSLDYGAGHVQGAINIPVDSSAEIMMQAMQGIPRSKNIVVYCQSKACQYDERIAVRLYQLGFANMSLFPAGYIEWQRTHGGETHE